MSGFDYVWTDLRDHLAPTLTKAFWPTPSQLVAIVVCTSVVYLFLVFFLQFSRRSMLGHSSMLDLVLMLVLANGVQNAMVAGDATLLGGLAAAFTLFAWDGLLGLMRRHFPNTRRYLGGERIQLIVAGQIQHDRLAREELDVTDLERAAKQQGLSDLKSVYDAFLELDGSLTVVPIAEAAGTPPSQLRPLRRKRRRHHG
jgi:uncharacterized membrane protein YcaP (DUF421 family)